MVLLPASFCWTGPTPVLSLPVWKGWALPVMRRREDLQWHWVMVSEYEVVIQKTPNGPVVYSLPIRNTEAFRGELAKNKNEEYVEIMAKSELHFVVVRPKKRWQSLFLRLFVKNRNREDCMTSVDYSMKVSSCNRKILTLDGQCWLLGFQSPHEANYFGHAVLCASQNTIGFREALLSRHQFLVNHLVSQTTSKSLNAKLAQGECIENLREDWIENHERIIIEKSVFADLFAKWEEKLAKRHGQGSYLGTMALNLLGYCQVDSVNISDNSRRTNLRSKSGTNISAQEGRPKKLRSIALANEHAHPSPIARKSWKVLWNLQNYPRTLLFCTFERRVHPYDCGSCLCYIETDLNLDINHIRNGIEAIKDECSRTSEIFLGKIFNDFAVVEYSQRLSSSKSPQTLLHFMSSQFKKRLIRCRNNFVKYGKTERSSSFIKHAVDFETSICRTRVPFPEDLCPICLLDMHEFHRVGRFPVCDHYFHVQCLVQWIKFNMTRYQTKLHSLLSEFHQGLNSFATAKLIRKEYEYQRQTDPFAIKCPTCQELFQCI